MYCLLVGAGSLPPVTSSRSSIIRTAFPSVPFEAPKIGTPLEMTLRSTDSLLVEASSIRAVTKIKRSSSVGGSIRLPEHFRTRNLLHRLEYCERKSSAAFKCFKASIKSSRDPLRFARHTELIKSSLSR
ncbi:unnamed protein product [Haemonchus placei]|uniref:Secreted protein n=1 Tax=Haemonchus placei TaxID=6290 RepID=A0A0N4WUG9_HAEPC|nr:unnamed protein product [Haemonchus placei]